MAAPQTQERRDQAIRELPDMDGATAPFDLDAALASAFPDLDDAENVDEILPSKERQEPPAKAPSPGRAERAESDAPSTAEGTPSGSADEKAEAEKLYTKEQYERSRAEANRARDKAVEDARRVAQEAETLRQQVAEANRNRDIWFQTQELLKERLGPNGDGISVHDFDAAQRAAYEMVMQREQQRATHLQIEQQVAHQQRAAVDNSLKDRNIAASQSFAATISALASDAMKSGVANIDIHEAFVAAAEAEEIKEDIAEWSMPEISTQRADLLIKRIHRKGAEIVRQKIAAERALLEAATPADGDEPDRREVYGDASGGFASPASLPDIINIDSMIAANFANWGDS